MAQIDLPTNFSNGTQVDGVGSLFDYAAYATSDWFGTGIIIFIFLLSFGASALLNVGKAFASAAFISFIFSVYLARIGALNPTIPFVLAVLVIVGFFWAKGERSNY